MFRGDRLMCKTCRPILRSTTPLIKPATREQYSMPHQKKGDVEPIGRTTLSGSLKLQVVNRVNAPANPFHFSFFTCTMNDIADLFFGKAGLSSQRFDRNSFFKSFHDGEHLVGGCKGLPFWCGLFFSNRHRLCFRGSGRGIFFKRFCQGFGFLGQRI